MESLSISTTQAQSFNKISSDEIAGIAIKDLLDEEFIGIALTKEYKQYKAESQLQDPVFNQATDNVGLVSIDLLTKINRNEAVGKIQIPVDVNLYPAGSRNLDKEGLFRLANYFSQYKGRKLVIVPENAGAISTNPNYYHSLLALYVAAKVAEVEVDFRTIGESNIQKYLGKELIDAKNFTDSKEAESFVKLQSEPHIQSILHKLQITAFNKDHYSVKDTTILHNADGAHYAAGVTSQDEVDLFAGYHQLNAVDNKWQHREKKTFFDILRNLKKEYLKYSSNPADQDLYKQTNYSVSKKSLDININGSGKLKPESKPQLIRATRDSLIKYIKNESLREELPQEGESAKFTIFYKRNKATNSKGPTFGQGVAPIEFTIPSATLQKTISLIELKKNIKNATNDDEKKSLQNKFETLKQAVNREVEDLVAKRIGDVEKDNLSSGGFKGHFFKFHFGTGSDNIILMHGVPNDKEVTVQHAGRGFNFIGGFERGNSDESSKNKHAGATSLNRNNPTQEFGSVTQEEQRQYQESPIAQIISKAVQQEISRLEDPISSHQKEPPYRTKLDEEKAKGR
jgi:hypothetical protein